jgi:hypothetical protein
MRLTQAVLLDLCRGWAAHYSTPSFVVPPRLIVGCAVAESNFGKSPRRPVHPSDDTHYWPDVSFGIFQQTVRWSREYVAVGFHGEWPGRPFVQFIEDRYRDPEYAAAVAVPQLRAYWSKEQDALNALCRYNAPGIDPAQNPNRANYQRGLDRADAMLSQ